MNVASLDLCRELYELSGWDSETYFSKHGDLRPVDADDIDESKPPAYDLGYLLRKLATVRDQFEEATLELRLINHEHWSIVWDNGLEFGSKGYHMWAKPADTPENAACKLAIELIKQGVVKP